jgi:glycosyltransferase EpsF
MNEMLPKLKVLHVIQGFGAGGAETWLLSAVKFLRAHPELNMQFDFLVVGGKPELFDDEIKFNGAKIFYLKYSLFKFFSFSRQVKKILRQEKYDAIHHHQDFISGWHFLAAAGHLPAVTVTHLHNPYNYVQNYVVNAGRWISFKLGRVLTVALTNKISATSDWVMDQYGYDKWPYKKKRVAPSYCGFDVQRFKFNALAKEKLCSDVGWNPQDKIALFLGRIGLQEYDTAPNQKNPSFAFSIAKQLVSDNEQWNFLFVGHKGLLGEKMEAELRGTVLEHKIKFLGITNDVPTMMSASSVFIFPSLWEGLGMVAVEAQASGLPVVMSASIPKEAIINPDIVVIKDLSEGADAWTQAIKIADSIQIAREKCSTIIEDSPFSISNSIQRLRALYQ